MTDLLRAAGWLALLGLVVLVGGIVFDRLSQAARSALP